MKNVEIDEEDFMFVTETDTFLGTVIIVVKGGKFVGSTLLAAEVQRACFKAKSLIQKAGITWKDAVMHYLEKG